jgi:hypothetical protein
MSATGHIKKERKPSRDASLRAVYGQANQNFRKLTSIRFQLLTLLPLGTGLGVVSKAYELHPEIAVFGAVVTVALWVYDQRNDQHYDELVSQLASLERDLRIPDGPFGSRPRTWWSLPSSRMVEHRWPITTVYAMSLITWLSLLLSQIVARVVDGPISNFVSWLAMTGVVWGAATLAKNRREADEHRVREAAKGALRLLERLIPQILRGEAPGDAELRDSVVQAIEACAMSKVDVRSRLAYHLEDCQFEEVGDDKRLGSRRAAHILGQITDLPARWIEDLAGRRAVISAPTQASPYGVPAFFIISSATLLGAALGYEGRHPAAKITHPTSSATPGFALATTTPSAARPDPSTAPSRNAGADDSR